MLNSIRCAVIGYGGAFNMGRAHAQYIQQTAGLSLSAICDLDPNRTAAASEDFPDAQTFNSIDQLLNAPDVDLCVIVLPHNLHAPVALQCLNAGKHVVSEKPMCISTEEATAMIEAAREAGKMLSVFHNRRQDADYQKLRQLIVEDGIIGDVFGVEIWSGGFHAQNPQWWRSSKEISGGYFYDWGAHFLDWLLGLVPGKITDVSGYFQKRMWHDVTNEDQTQAIIRFENGCVANITMSSIAHADKPRWWVLGTKGAIVDRGGHFEVRGDFKAEGHGATLRVPYRGDSQWQTYYANIAGHLTRGEELMVKPEQARRVIAIMEAAEVSSREGHSVSLPTEDEDAAWGRSE